MRKLLALLVVLWGFCLSLQAQTCSNNFLIDFSAGSQGGTPTTTTIGASIFGLPSVSLIFPQGTGTDTVTYDTTASHTMGGVFPPLCNGTPWTSPNSSTVGMKFLINGPNQYRVFLTIPAAPGGTSKPNIQVFGVWFKTGADPVLNSTINLDSFTPYYHAGGGQDNNKFVNIPIVHGVKAGMETSSGANQPGYPPGVKCPNGTNGNAHDAQLAANTWYFMVSRFSRDAATPDSVRVYAEGPGGTVGTVLSDSTDIDSLLPPCPGAAGVNELHFGHNSNNPGTSTGFSNYFGPIVGCAYTVSGDCAYPDSVMPKDPITIESAANGSGSAIGPQTINSGSTLVSYCIDRNVAGTFSGNSACTWSLTNKTGGIVNGDLVAAGDGKSATLTGAVPGTATIQAYDANNIVSTSGVITVQDVTAPVPGNSGTITTASIGASSLTLNWTKATDAISPQNTLQYEVCRSLSNNISTVNDCEAAFIALSFTTDINTFGESGLSGSTTYYFNVVVKDQYGNKAAYSPVNATTSAQAPAASGGSTGAHLRR